MIFCRKRHHFAKTNREFLCPKAASGAGGDVSCSLVLWHRGDTGGTLSPGPSPWVLLSPQSPGAGEAGVGGEGTGRGAHIVPYCSCRSTHIRSGKFLLFPFSFLWGGGLTESPPLLFQPGLAVFVFLLFLEVALLALNQGRGCGARVQPKSCCQSPETPQNAACV